MLTPTDCDRLEAWLDYAKDKLATYRTGVMPSAQCEIHMIDVCDWISAYVVEGPNPDDFIVVPDGRDNSLPTDLS
jgi:hypothetical protein